jgi:hypothetical protein
LFRVTASIPGVRREQRIDEVELFFDNASQRSRSSKLQWSARGPIVRLDAPKPLTEILVQVDPTGKSIRRARSGKLALRAADSSRSSSVLEAGQYGGRTTDIERIAAHQMRRSYWKKHPLRLGSSHG